MSNVCWSGAPIRASGCFSHASRNWCIHGVLRSRSVPLLMMLLVEMSAARQGLTLVHVSAQLKRFLWDRGRIQGLLRGSKGALGDQGVFVSDRAQFKL
jgi:hypothetical protein